ncbi:MAG TPA: helix-turn-helix transcriptional regulator [Ktedonobacteraceae bacterium]|nr:helix-turn-helix transcriptional regulator [Ktedonobacteraceae bacterium]
MSTSSQQMRLAALLEQLGWSQADLARRSRTSLSVVARAVHGEQISAVGRARNREGHQCAARGTPAAGTGRVRHLSYWLSITNRS